MGLISLGDQLNRGARRGTLGLAPSDTPMGVADHLCLFPHHRTDRLSSSDQGPEGDFSTIKSCSLVPPTLHFNLLQRVANLKFSSRQNSDKCGPHRAYRYSHQSGGRHHCSVVRKIH